MVHHAVPQEGGVGRYKSAINFFLFENESDIYENEWVCQMID